MILLICLLSLWLLQPIYRRYLDLSNSMLRYDLNMRNLFCFTMGMIFCRFSLPQMSRGKEIATAILAGCVFVAAVFMKNLGWPWSELMFIISVLTGSLMLWMIISPEKWPLGLLGCSFPLYVFHTIVIDLIGAPLKAFGVYSQVVKGLGLFGFAGIVIVITIMGTRLLKKHCPKTAAVIFGGR